MSSPSCAARSGRKLARPSPSSSPMASASAMAPVTLPTASTLSISWRRKTTLLNSSKAAILSACASTASCPIPAALAASAAAPASSANTKSWPTRPSSPSASMASRIRLGAMPAACPAAAARSSSIRARRRSARSRRFPTARPSRRVTSCAFARVAVAAWAIPMIVPQKACSKTSAAVSSPQTPPGPSMASSSLTSSSMPMRRRGSAPTARPQNPSTAIPTSMSLPDMATENSPTNLAVAVDIGGTFTDVALVDGTGRSWRAKTPSIPSDPSEAFLNGIRLALQQAGASATDLDQVLHGTTVATNMILEGKGARTALVTTRGFRHVLAIGRQDIPRKANLYTWIKPVPPVPASRILEVDERVAAGGAVLEALDEATVRAAAMRIRGMDVEAVAICLIHAYANPAHERRVAEILREELPDLAITVSSDLLPVVREYERSLTTVLNATVMPGVTSYVARLEKRLEDEGATPPLMLMQSNGGVAGAPKIRIAPALTALSGPAAGVVGARAAAAACGIEDIITVDIGGTSADICLIKGG